MREHTHHQPHSLPTHNAPNWRLALSATLHCLLGRAFKQVLVAEGLSIAVMEGVEVVVAVYTPGVMQAHVTDSIFWLRMLLGLAAGFVAAFPVNYIFVSKGIRHQH